MVAPSHRAHDRRARRNSWPTAAFSAAVAAKVVSERLGHASVAITLDTYAHAHLALQEEAARAVASLILAADNAKRARRALVHLHARLRVLSGYA
jgi:hypothetical protein